MTTTPLEALAAISALSTVDDPYYTTTALSEVHRLCHDALVDHYAAEARDEDDGAAEARTEAAETYAAATALERLHRLAREARTTVIYEARDNGNVIIRRDHYDSLRLAIDRITTHEVTRIDGDIHTETEIG